MDEKAEASIAQVWRERSYWYDYSPQTGWVLNRTRVSRVWFLASVIIAQSLDSVPL